MSRSRSSFDLSAAIATAGALSDGPAPEAPARPFEGVALVSFQARADATATRTGEPQAFETRSGGATRVGEPPSIPGSAGPPGTRAFDRSPMEGGPTPPTGVVAPAPTGSRPDGRAGSLEPGRPISRTLPPDPMLGTPPPPAASRLEAMRPPTRPPSDDAPETTRKPDPAPRAEAAPTGGPDGRSVPPLPDLEGVTSLIVRCERMVDWIADATGASEVFIVDASGLPIAGAVYDVDERLARTGNVATSLVGLAATVGATSAPLFEAHMGDGPFFQLVGFSAGSTSYVVGLVRPTPLSPKQAHAIRLACQHTLGAALRGGL